MAGNVTAAAANCFNKSRRDRRWVGEPGSTAVSSRFREASCSRAKWTAEFSDVSEKCCAERFLEASLNESASNRANAATLVRPSQCFQTRAVTRLRQWAFWLR